MWQCLLLLFSGHAAYGSAVKLILNDSGNVTGVEGELSTSIGINSYLGYWV